MREKSHEEKASGSPPFKGGVAAASADGVVLSALRNADLGLRIALAVR